MICKNCKKEGTGRFCSHCGTPFLKETKMSDAIAEFEKERIEEEKAKNKQAIEESNIEMSSQRYSQNQENPIKACYDILINVWKNAVGKLSNKRKSRKKETNDSKSLKPSWIKRLCSHSNKNSNKKKTSLTPSIKTPQVATNTFKKTISRGLQVFSFLCMLGIGAILLFATLETKSKFGTIKTMISERNMPLAIFIVCMGSMIAFAALSMLWIASKKKIQKDDSIKCFDSGRGLMSFLCYGITILLSPEILKQFPTSYEGLRGLEEAMRILYENTSLLGSLVVFGVVSCLIRKIMRI